MAGVWSHGRGRRLSVRVRAVKAKGGEKEPEPQLTESQLKAKTQEWQRKFLLDQAVVSPTVRPSLASLMAATCSLLLLGAVAGKLLFVGLGAHHPSLAWVWWSQPQAHQQTLKSSFIRRGIGLHSGAPGENNPPEKVSPHVTD